MNIFIKKTLLIVFKISDALKLHDNIQKVNPFV